MFLKTATDFRNGASFEEGSATRQPLLNPQQPSGLTPDNTKERRLAPRNEDGGENCSSHKPLALCNTAHSSAVASSSHLTVSHLANKPRVLPNEPLLTPLLLRREKLERQAKLLGLCDDEWDRFHDCSTPKLLRCLEIKEYRRRQAAALRIQSRWRTFRWCVNYYWVVRRYHDAQRRIVAYWRFYSRYKKPRFHRMLRQLTEKWANRRIKDAVFGVTHKKRVLREMRFQKLDPILQPFEKLKRDNEYRAACAIQRLYLRHYFQHGQRTGFFRLRAALLIQRAYREHRRRRKLAMRRRLKRAHTSGMEKLRRVTRGVRHIFSLTKAPVANNTSAVLIRSTSSRRTRISLPSSSNLQGEGEGNDQEHADGERVGGDVEAGLLGRSMSRGSLRTSVKVLYEPAVVEKVRDRQAQYYDSLLQPVTTARRATVAGGTSRFSLSRHSALMASISLHPRRASKQPPTVHASTPRGQTRMVKRASCTPKPRRRNARSSVRQARASASGHHQQPPEEHANKAEEAPQPTAGKPSLLVCLAEQPKEVRMREARQQQGQKAASLAALPPSAALHKPKPHRTRTMHYRGSLDSSRTSILKHTSRRPGRMRNGLRRLSSARIAAIKSALLGGQQLLFEDDLYVMMEEDKQGRERPKANRSLTLPNLGKCGEADSETGSVEDGA
ncbi:unnamed protein product [Vitrella brassicaformis CCMP3155]|uniref:Uncharacterized protein n=1 Tax=Vitrella brassicaformis (strain CCMP3155) TaxID=1169540 RepID=A0A0G4G5F2_VITBC|nr:unnamed protein product [Vitrella brassicaformis CCMP3155]|eukprot:CEM23465.1 unnamed protein product [Vitrella brassicaformis CCMP3155]